MRQRVRQDGGRHARPPCAALAASGRLHGCPLPTSSPSPPTLPPPNLAERSGLSRSHREAAALAPRLRCKLTDAAAFDVGHPHPHARRYLYVLAIPLVGFVHAIGFFLIIGIACDDLFIVHDHLARAARTAARHRHHHCIADQPDAADADADADADVGGEFAEDAGFGAAETATAEAAAEVTAVASDMDLDARLMAAWRQSLGAVAMTTATNVGAFLTTLQSSVPNLFTFGILMAREAPFRSPIARASPRPLF